MATVQTPKLVVKNLGVRLDKKLITKEHATTTVGACFHVLSLLRRVFPFLPLTTRKTLIQALVLSRLDYCNALLISPNEASLNRMQVIQNTVAHLVSNAPPRTASLPLLQQLHWFLVRKQIRFKICCIVHKSLNGQGPSYLAVKCTIYLPLRSLRSGTKSRLLTPRYKKISPWW